MKKTIGAILVVLGLLAIVLATLNASNAPNPSYLIGTYVSGLLLLVFGLVLCHEKMPRAVEGSAEDGKQPAANGMEARSNQFRARADFCLLVGGVLVCMGIGFSQLGPDFWFLGTAVQMGGSSLFLWGCVNFARWKGYSGWYGFCGQFLLLGLLILICMPNRRKRLFQDQPPEPNAAAKKLSAEDQRPGYRYLVMLLPQVVFTVGLAGFLLLFRSMDVRSDIDGAEWKEVAPQNLGFRALMPGTPSLTQNTQEKPAGKIEWHKFTVTPKGKNELFMIISSRFPESVGRKLGVEKLLEIGRQDILSATQGKLESERRIDLSGRPGLELEVLPPNGVIMKARIYARKNQVCQVVVHVPMIRLPSKDVEKFFDSFELLAEPDAAQDRGG
jgi:hypothetical protein